MLTVSRNTHVVRPKFVAWMVLLVVVTLVVLGLVLGLVALAQEAENVRYYR